MTTVSPDEKLECKLDTVRQLLADIKPGAHMAVVDDKSGFLQGHLEKESSRMCFLRFGNGLYRPHGLMFGLTQSPAKFQQLNRVAVNALLLRDVCVLLYLDDRLVRL